MGVPKMRKNLSEVKAQLLGLTPALILSGFDTTHEMTSCYNGICMLSKFDTYLKYSQRMAANFFQVIRRQISGAQTLAQLLEGVRRLLRRNWLEMDLYTVVLLWLQVTLPGNGLLYSQKLRWGINTLPSMR